MKDVGYTAWTRLDGKSLFDGVPVIIPLDHHGISKPRSHSKGSNYLTIFTSKSFTSSGHAQRHSPKEMDGPVRQLGSADGMPVLGMRMMLTNS